jgi:serine/threonine protein kinase
MAAAVAHTHLVAHTYHMDIKPGNFLLDDDWNLLLIDWEQNDAPVTTVAPEIDGSWDVKLSSDGSLVYSKYTGPERRIMPESTPGGNGWNLWNVYPIWIKQCPKAAELAEVFSLGRCMWMLLRQPDTDFEDIEDTLDIED